MWTQEENWIDKKEIMRRKEIYTYKYRQTTGKKIVFALTALLALCLVACDKADSECPGGADGAPRTFLFSYEIPDAETADASSVKRTSASSVTGAPDTTPSSVTRTPGTTSSVGTENVIESVRLLFFERDAYGNGAFVGSLLGEQEGKSLEKVGELAVTLTDPVSEDVDYNVLVIANADQYITPADLEAFCRNRTENLVKLELMPALNGTPVAGTSHKEFTVPGGCLPMSASAVKEAGKGMKVTLLRAAVRIDVTTSIPESMEEVIIEQARIANIVPAVPLFCDPRTVEGPYLWGAIRKLDKADATPENEIKGGLYAMETYNTASSRAELITRRTCLLVQCHTKSYTGPRNWYRVDINVTDTETKGRTMQFLKRNNVYVVQIEGIRGLGVESAEEAYYADATMIDSVTIPGQWNDSGVTPPEVEVN